MLLPVLLPSAHVDYSGCSEHEEVVRVMLQQLLQRAEHRELELELELVGVVHQLLLALGAQVVVYNPIHIWVQV